MANAPLHAVCEFSAHLGANYLNRDGLWPDCVVIRVFCGAFVGCAIDKSRANFSLVAEQKNYLTWSEAGRTLISVGHYILWLARREEPKLRGKLGKQGKR